jgi:hypothetical protein
MILQTSLNMRGDQRWMSCHRLVSLFISNNRQRTRLYNKLVTTDWLFDYDGVRLTSQNRVQNGPIVHPPCKCDCRPVVVMMSAGDNSWLVFQSSLAVLPAETSGASRRNGRRSENFAYQYLKYLKGSFTRRKILRHGTFRLYFPS